MRVTSKGQVTIPLHVREQMGIRTAETEIEFICDEQGRWFLQKIESTRTQPSRFRMAHKTAKLTMNTDEILALTRGRAAID